MLGFQPSDRNTAYGLSCMTPTLNYVVMQGAQLEALKVLTLLLAQLGKAMVEHAPELMQRAWQLLSGEQERASCAAWTG